MTSRKFRLLIRRWRWVIVAGPLIGFVVGWVSAPGETPPPKQFEATHTLLLAREIRSGTEGVQVSTVLATLGPVPDRVAARLGIGRQQVRSMVAAKSGGPGVLLITARSADRAQAEALANVAAEELVVELGGANSPFHSLEPAVAAPVKSDDIKGPTSRPSRSLLFGLLGLLLGVGAAFLLDRFDNRIRSKPGAEAVLDVAVIAEIPPLPRADRGRMLIGEHPSSFIEAYRRLPASISRWRARADDGPGRIIVVTSPTGGEGTTTTVAHLAATLGEIGRSVVAISADLRHPQLHLYFDKAREPGLTDVLAGVPGARRLADLDLVTTVRGVRFVSSGVPVRNPSPLLNRIADHLRDARNMADFVLIDAPPLLTTSEGADLARHADGVLLVVRSGWTSVGAATRSAELLERLSIPVVGAVLIGSDGTGLRT